MAAQPAQAVFLGGDPVGGPASSARDDVGDSRQKVRLPKELGWAAATPGRSQQRPEAEADMLLAPLRAQDPVVVHALWRRYLPLILPVLHCAFLGNQTVVDEAVLDVFLQVFRWGPGLPMDAELHTCVMRAVTRTVKRLSTARRSA